MTGRRGFFIILGLVIVLQSGFGLTIKIGSTAPDGSPWDLALDEMAAQWARITDNHVQVRIYPGGSTGGETDMLRKVRIGQLQGAVITTGGLISISSDMLIFTLPMFIRNDNELNYVLDIMEPDLKQVLDEKGFSLIIWQTVGWVRPFSKQPVISPDDLKNLKLALPIENDSFIQAWKSIGYRIVQVDSNDFMTALQTGMIDAFIEPALVTASFQWFALASHMCEVNLAPLVGGLVLDNRIWSRIPEEYHPKLLESARETIGPLNESTHSLTERAIDLMEKNGLVSHNLDNDVMQFWVSDMEQSYNRLIGTSVDRDLFEKMETHLEDYRRNYD